jgi:hypothetical protein
MNRLFHCQSEAGKSAEPFTLEGQVFDRSWTSSLPQYWQELF